MKPLYKYELQPKFDARKSFYNKAYVLESGDNNFFMLVSYDTPIMIIENKSIYYINKDKYNYSQTTLRHLKEFLKQMNDLLIMYNFNINKCTLRDINKNFKTSFISDKEFNKVEEYLNRIYAYFPY